MNIEQLPAGWSRATIADLCELSPKPPSDIDSNLAVSFVPMAAVSDVNGRIERPEQKTAAEVRKGFTHFSEGDVIWAKITPCMENGKAAVAENLLNGFGFGSTEFMVLRSHGAITPHLLHRFMRQERYRRKARKMMQSGVGQARVPKEFVLESKLPVPPLAEQRRIVAKLDTLQARADAAKAALDAVPPLLERFRQSVLAAAFRGDLTRAWREAHPDVEPATELLARIRTERRLRWETANPRKKYVEPEPVDTSNLPDLPDGWCWATVEEICWASGYGTSQKCHREASGPVVLRIPNVQGGYLDFDDLKFATEQHALRDQDQLAPGDFLFVRTNGSRDLIGRGCYVAQKTMQPLYFASYLIRLRLVSNDVGEWFALNWNGGPTRSLVLAGAASSAGQYNISMSSALMMPIPLAPVREIKRAVDAMDSLLTLAADCARKMETSSEQLSALHQSILAKAFRGELVPQDPDDEPASVLLERIAQAKAQQATAKPKRGRPATKPR